MEIEDPIDLAQTAILRVADIASSQGVEYERPLLRDVESICNMDVLGGGDRENPILEAGDIADVTPFLRQSAMEIHDKFEDMEWMQRTRLAEDIRSNDPLHPYAPDADPKVKERNRYLNVQAWASNRIHLRVSDGECDLLNGLLSRILRPEKCAQYFPLDMEQATIDLSEKSDVFASEEKQVKTAEATVVGKITLSESAFNENTRSEIRRLELRIARITPAWCIVVQALAARGLDSLLRELESGQLLTVMNPSSDPVFETINKLRQQRMMIVHNEIQMQFVYETLHEQTCRKLGKIPDHSHSYNCVERSAKKSRPIDEADHEPVSKPELEAVSDSLTG
ncbi:Protein-tyrosine phosphatase catalytic [Penicillium coprophilum]|uniref:Protein-tyrosine phosphatase catalytic n=1 Tax=Penicillium coprophilum TaxID=36646 RepID=UPI00238AA3A9|nr:Protein-tyrosine phosphatase catalytic [Penicillium coprophilum]KAJ5164835.1 Protein-tyrosine phosphatase catalytic [Penicillium coprophilum]